jgi:hypothetical protein
LTERRGLGAWRAIWKVWVVFVGAMVLVGLKEEDGCAEMVIRRGVWR